ncbi:MAG TPA: ricin-type beta-trefoil lectin domain protein, partial [Candidatus Saccharimonadia bacterium]|nr:ricin-type beta-trefoil lectin domain protein [Candidatus Saccharimonadia bacterium]
VLIVFISLLIISDHSSSPIYEIRSGITDYCLDDHHDSRSSNAIVDLWKCNNSAAQSWKINQNEIIHNNDCLSIQGNSNISSKVVLSTCSSSANQTWVAVASGYENPSSAFCLSAPAKNAQLALSSCKGLTGSSEVWAAATFNKKNNNTPYQISCNQGTDGQRVACNAAKQWFIWQSNKIAHNTLLNNYTDGNGYEEWCADFISYVYKQAGYPFVNGERNGWDEYLATNIINMGFSYHSASNYTPKAGDVAFFDYSTGHVEIVLVGGKKPIFIYGDSGTTDPTTGNGDMAENTITNDGVEGQAIYYLSPN